MTSYIYVVNPTTQEPEKVEPASFLDIGVKERADLEQWVIKHPELLGERLLVITSEYDKFDGSNRRLDVLALDANGVLVIVELKLDASRSLADLQAIHYAAFCSTMAMDSLVEELANFDASTKEEASEKICKFLRTDELPTLGNRPRVILAAGSINDQELTSCVLWLRSFGVDISCVELTPYRMPASPQIILVPRVVIPVPEAREYLIGIEQKEVVQSRQTKDKSMSTELLQAVTEEFNKLGMSFRASGKPSDGYI